MGLASVQAAERSQGTPWLCSRGGNTVSDGATCDKRRPHLCLKGGQHATQAGACAHTHGSMHTRYVWRSLQSHGHADPQPPAGRLAARRPLHPTAMHSCTQQGIEPLPGSPRTFARTSCVSRVGPTTGTSPHSY